MIVENISVGRLDYLGVISGIMKELGISTLIDSRILPDDQEEITTGEAIEGMILNGLGFSDRPISLTSQFFENKPLDVLFREGVRPEYFNRFKLGRSLDKVCAYGCDLLFGELALMCVSTGGGGSAVQ
jgi:transposase